jgi:hypothetical protein
VSHRDSSAIETRFRARAIETHSNPFQCYLYNYLLSKSLYRVPHIFLRTIDGGHTCGMRPRAITTWLIPGSARVLAVQCTAVRGMYVLLVLRTGPETYSETIPFLEQQISHCRIVWALGHRKGAMTPPSVTERPRASRSKMVDPSISLPAPSATRHVPRAYIRKMTRLQQQSSY